MVVVSKLSLLVVYLFVALLPFVLCFHGLQLPPHLFLSLSLSLSLCFWSVFLLSLFCYYYCCCNFHFPLNVFLHYHTMLSVARLICSGSIPITFR
jgi:hypothetical protein